MLYTMDSITNQNDKVSLTLEYIWKKVEKLNRVKNK